VNVGGVTVVSKDGKIYSTTFSTIIKAGQHIILYYITSKEYVEVGSNFFATDHDVGLKRGG
jgi:hypothetical protein